MVQSSNDQNQKTYGIEDGVSLERRQVNRAIKKKLNRGLAAGGEHTGIVSNFQYFGRALEI
jgi:hypothetical protein